MNMRSIFFLHLAILSCLFACTHSLRAQAVTVTMSLDTNRIAVGGSTVLRVYAQVVPTLQASADRIFSWYVDVLSSNGLVAFAHYDMMQKTASDNHPLISSLGFSSGANRHGIYDTFLNLPGAGTSDRVELMAIPIQGTGVGTTRFSVRTGTGVPGLSEDFIVAPNNGGDPWTGGDYSLAHADLVVSCGNVRLGIQPAGGTSLLLRFTPCDEMDHTIEFRNSLESGQWQPLPGGPHNSGSITVTNVLSRQFFRLRIDP